MTPDIERDTDALRATDERLVETARETTALAFDPGRWDGAHMVGAALRASDGEVFTGVSLPASVGRASMCAEPVALGTAAAAGVSEFEACVAVRHPLPDEARTFEVVPPCGSCRELLVDYGPEMSVIVPEGDTLDSVAAVDLLPARTW